MEQTADMQVKTSRFEQIVKKLYLLLVYPCVPKELHRQRLKLLWFVWDYWPIVVLKSFSFFDRLRLLRRFLRIDWGLVHGHLPSEIAFMCKALASRNAKFDEVVVEAGCWKGGSAAKLSIICKMLGYRLLIYDSFEGVETPPLDQQGREAKWFFGNYAAPESIVRENLQIFGEPSVCLIQKGWFKDTLAKTPVPYPVRLAYIDCDLLKGTEEALTGLVPSLVEDGYIFSEDFHLREVRNLLCKPGSLERFGKGPMLVTPLGEKLASLRFKGTR